MLAKKIQDAGFKLSLVDGGILIRPFSKLTDEQRQFIKLNKQEIISELKAINDKGKRKIFWWFYKLREDESGYTRMPFLHDDETKIRKELESIYGHQVYDLRPLSLSLK